MTDTSPRAMQLHTEARAAGNGRNYTTLAEITSLRGETARNRAAGLRTAWVCSRNLAEHFFDQGRTIVVSVEDRGPSMLVGPSSTTHDRTSTTWAELAATVDSYGDPRQRFFVVQEG